MAKNYVEKFGKKMLEKMYYTMVEIREFEENIYRNYKKGLSYGGLHVGVGEEACAVGSVFPLRPDDKIVTYHRGHGHSIAKGADVNRMVAELMSKATGLCKGRGGSVHLLDMCCGQMGSQGIVGAQGTVAPGVALAGRLKGEDYVTLCLFGDGAANEGQMHEGMNLAGVLKLPVVFICVNNGYAVSTPSEYSIAGGSVAARAGGYGMDGFTVDGNNVFEVYDAVENAVDMARNGNGPALIELKTYRWFGHYLGDPCAYRADGEVDWWKNNKDPICFLKEYLLDHGVSTEEELEALAKKAIDVIEDANAFAIASPDPNYEEIFTDLYYHKEEE